MIDYFRLAESIKYYEEMGFQRIETPWTVTKYVQDITRPEHRTEWTIEEKGKVLVASGEQSYLYLGLKGFLPRGSFQTITPCFRDEPFDQLHTKYFMKNELICTDDVTKDRLDFMTETAAKFFSRYLPDAGVEVVPNEQDGYDLEWDGVELGSYGIRSCDFMDWIYGTGLAEPRFSMAVNMYKKG